jgi:phosphoribosylanthranilate isomerase
MPKVKICGNTNIEDARLAAELGADYLGLIFTESKRRVTPETARDIIRSLPDFRHFVAVFYNQTKPEVERVAEELGIRILQFHGEETALYCRSFTEKGYEVIKSFRIKDAMSLKRIDEYNVSAFLFDTYSKEDKGGTGVPFDWELIEDRPYVHEKLFLAGGLNVENLREAIGKVRPFAVDVASGVEKSPGKKDPRLLEEFIRIAKEGERAWVRK